MTLTKVPEYTRTYCQTEDDVIHALVEWQQNVPPLLGFDLETTGLDPKTGHILLAQLSDGQRTVIIHVPHFRKAFLKEWLEPLLTHPDCTKLIHNAPFERAWCLHHWGIDVTPFWDTKLGDIIIRCGLIPVAEMQKASSLENCALQYLGRKLDKILQLSFVDQDPEKFVPTPEQLDYAALDAEIVFPLFHREHAIIEEEGLGATAQIENEVCPVLQDMELRGVYVDRAAWLALVEDLEHATAEHERKLIDELTPAIVISRAKEYKKAQAVRRAWEDWYQQVTDRLELEADDLTFATPLERRRWIQLSQRKAREYRPRPKIPHLDEGPINLNSHPQLTAALEHFGIKLRDHKGLTIAQAIPKHPKQHELLESLLLWKQLYKLQSAFGRSILGRIDPEGRLHPEFWQIVQSGRTSCRRPNLQQIPAGKRGGLVAEFAARFRACFKAPAGRKLVVADYAAIEFRIAAEIHGEQWVIEAFREGLDPHQRTAAKVLGLAESECGKGTQAREDAKITNYGVMYGLNELGLAHQTKKSVPDAKAYLDAWKLEFPHLWGGLVQDGERAVLWGETNTILGRKRRYTVPGAWEADSAKDIATIRRRGMNAPIQGTSADITKMALIRIDRRLRMEELDAFLVNQVHDEIIVEAHAADANYVAVLVKQEMLKAAQVVLKKVPVEVEVCVTDVWTH